MLKLTSDTKSSKRSSPALHISQMHNELQPKMQDVLLDLKFYESSTNQLQQLSPMASTKEKTKRFWFTTWVVEPLTYQFWRFIKSMANLKLKSKPQRVITNSVEMTSMTLSSNGWSLTSSVILVSICQKMFKQCHDLRKQLKKRRLNFLVLNKLRLIFRSLPCETVNQNIWT